MLARRSKPSGAPKGTTYDDDPGRKKWPDLVDFLSQAEWSPGEARLPGKVLFFIDQGKLKACVTNVDSDEYAFLSLDGLTTAFSVLDKALATDSLDWRVQKQWDGSKGKGRKT